MNRLSYEYVKLFVEEKGCKLISLGYKNHYCYIEYICECKNIWKAKFDDFKRGSRCRTCGRNKIIKKNTLTKEFVFNQINLTGYKVISTEYIDSTSKLTLICPNGHIIKMNWSRFKESHIDKKRCCKKCYNKDKCYNYNPNITQIERETNRNLKEYYHFRNLVYKRDNFTCQKCKDNKGGNLNAHHLNGYHWDKNNRFNPNNGVTLCETCHTKFHDIYGNKNNTIFQYNEWNKDNQINQKNLLSNVPESVSPQVLGCELPMQNEGHLNFPNRQALAT